jgi:ATP-binding cassette subfamily B protein
LLLAGLFEPTEGQLLWSGVDLADVIPAERRAAVSAVFQDFVRYELSVRENVALGAPHRLDDLEAIRQATAAVGLDEHVTNLALGYDTILSREYQDGAELSVGQWQRLAIARAFFRDTPVVLMDEPSAALDAVAEQDLFDRVRLLGEGRLLVYTSHRFSTVRNADRIIVLDEGRVVGDGAHDALMGTCELYRKMYNAQADVFTDQSPVDG